MSTHETDRQTDEQTYSFEFFHFFLEHLSPTSTPPSSKNKNILIYKFLDLIKADL